MSDHSLIVCAAASRRAGLLDRYESQLKAADIPLHLEPLTDADLGSTGMGTLGSKIAIYRRLAKKFEGYSRIVITDAWDILFYGTQAEVLAALPDDRTVILGSERNCFPDAHLAQYFWGETPWRFVNGGFAAGSPRAIRNWCDAVEKSDCYLPMAVDQQWLNWTLLASQNGGCTRWTHYASLDRSTKLCYTMMREQGTLGIQDGKLYNPLCDSQPLWLHFNGNSGADLWPSVEAASAIGVHLGIIDHFDVPLVERNLSFGVRCAEDWQKITAAGIAQEREVTA